MIRCLISERLAMSNGLICAVLLVLVTGCTNLGVVDSEVPNLHRQIMVTLVRPEIQAPDVLGFASSPDMKIAPRQARSPTGMVSKQLERKHGLRMVESWGIDALGVEVFLFEVRGAVSVDQVVRALSGEAQVESVQTVSSFRTLTYNDPYFYLQDAVSSDSIEQIHASSTGKGVTVGIIDTGVDTRHPELKDRIIYTENFVAHDQHRFDHDQHGTAVAGVIAAKANNDLGIVGVAPDVRLMAFKACWQENLMQTRCDSFSLVKALVKALQKKPDVLNLSLTGPHDPLVERLISQAAHQGIVVVGAVDQKLGLSQSFPANMSEVIAVTARPLELTFEETLEEPLTSNVERRGLIAPGTDILTTAPDAGYAFESGSSMSTAHVSGVVALLKEKAPTLSGSGIHDLLNRTARTWHRAPVVDMCAALMRLSDDTVCTSRVLADAMHISRSGESVKRN